MYTRNDIFSRLGLRTPSLYGTLALLVVATSLAVGCNDHGRPFYTHPGEEVRLWLRPSTTKVLKGEIVTINTYSTNTHGRDIEIEWSSTGGSLSPIQNGRIAQVKFENAGNYQVLAKLVEDGQILDSQSVNVTVNPIP